MSLGAVLLAAASVLRGGQGTETRVYFANLHSHTSYSDGSGTPVEAYLHAQENAKLDVLAITEHNHDKAEYGLEPGHARADGILIATNHKLYNGSDEGSVISAASRATVTGRFVALYGQEFSTISSGNHVNVFDVDDVIDVPNGLYRRLFLQWLPAHKDSTGQSAIVQLNHPDEVTSPAKLEYGRDDFGNSFTQWVENVGSRASLIEVFNADAMTTEAGGRVVKRMTADYLDYLHNGFVLGPTGNEDNHYRTWGDSIVRTGIVADELSQVSILDAMRRRHVYASEDKNLRVISRVNGSLCGDVVFGTALGTPLRLDIDISDDDEPGASYDLKVWSGVVGMTRASVKKEVSLKSGTSKVDLFNHEHNGEYVLFELTQKGKSQDVVWTAPVWHR